jgi:6-phosphogluconolactonase (cycloisomerase 2 family)
MKFNKVGQVSLVSAIALILASTFTACAPLTIDYLYVAGNKENPGQIQTFEVDRVSGALNQANAPISSGGVTPVSEASSTDYNHLYVANQGSSSIVEFTIGSGGSLTSTATITLSSEGNTPVAIAMNTAGTLLYVVNMYQPGCSTATTGAKTCSGGALAVFPVSSSGALGSPVANGSLSYFPVGVNPTAVCALPSGTAVYVTTYDPNAGNGYVYGFSATTAGALTSIVGNATTLPGTPFYAGVKPSGVATSSVSRFLYVTDFAQNEMIAYSILDGGVLHPLINGPFKTGNQPTAITIDPRGIFIYVSNGLDNTVSAYDIDLSTGTPSAAVATSGLSTNPTGTEPVAVLVDTGFGRYVYTANFLDNSITGFQLNSSTGVLSPTQNGPYPSIGQPAALVTIPHGNHSIQINQP